MKDGIVAVALMLMLPPGAAAQQRFEVLGAAVELPPPVREAPPEREKKCEPRSSWPTPLLATHTALQIAHTHSTRSALKTGWAREANPFMGWVMASDARAYTVKAGSAAGFWWWLDTYACEHPLRSVVDRHQCERPLRVPCRLQLQSSGNAAARLGTLAIRGGTRSRMSPYAGAGNGGRDTHEENTLARNRCGACNAARRSGSAAAGGPPVGGTRCTGSGAAAIGCFCRRPPALDGPDFGWSRDDRRRRAAGDGQPDDEIVQRRLLRQRDGVVQAVGLPRCRIGRYRRPARDGVVGCSGESTHRLRGDAARHPGRQDVRVLILPPGQGAAANRLRWS